jgi:hypothetical protein
MTCSCVYTVYTGYDGHDQDFVNTNHRKAIKEHQCCECHRVITIGEKYEYTAGCWEGDFATYKTCSDCRAIRDAFFCEGWLFTHVLENLADYIYDVGGDISESCVAELPPAARATVCELIEQQWD